ncbi:MAG TPA: hypothetical protein VGY66_22895 [Gemmataceae bacterium]|jgi:hypothetical protein|nr:hypothetical protein [Gemmataceae bacterium]
MNLVTAATPSLEFPERIEAILELSRKHPAMWPLPKRLEFQLCAYLVAWETLARGDATAHHALDLWRERCRKLHRKSGLTLADPIQRPGVPQRWGMTKQETTKAYQSVLQGLRRVYKGMRVQYHAETENDAAAGAPACILSGLLAESFRHAKSFADPHGLEAYLLTLLELFEASLDRDGSPLVALKLWRAEIRRKHTLGPSATRTLADVATADVRAARRKAFRQEEHTAVLRRIAESIEKIVEQMESYLASRGKRAQLGTRPSGQR